MIDQWLKFKDTNSKRWYDNDLLRLSATWILVTLWFFSFPQQYLKEHVQGANFGIARSNNVSENPHDWSRSTSILVTCGFALLESLRLLSRSGPGPGKHWWPGQATLPTVRPIRAKQTITWSSRPIRGRCLPTNGGRGGLASTSPQPRQQEAKAAVSPVSNTQKYK